MEFQNFLYIIRVYCIGLTPIHVHSETIVHFLHHPMMAESFVKTDKGDCLSEKSWNKLTSAIGLFNLAENV